MSLSKSSQSCMSTNELSGVVDILQQSGLSSVTCIKHQASNATELEIGCGYNKWELRSLQVRKKT